MGAYSDHYFGIIVSPHPDRTPYTLELMDITERFATTVVQNVKIAPACKRPDLYSAAVRPAIPMPSHGVLPFGHATEAAALALMLTKISGMGNVFKDDAFDEKEKCLLFWMSKKRFRNRRRMAYISPCVPVVDALLLALAILIDGIDPITCVGAQQNGVLTEKIEFALSKYIETTRGILTWLSGFFISFINIYFGASSFRPTS